MCSVRVFVCYFTMLTVANVEILAFNDLINISDELGRT